MPPASLAAKPLSSSIDEEARIAAGLAEGGSPPPEASPAGFRRGWGGCKRAIELTAPVGRKNCSPGVDRAWNGHSMDRIRRNRINVLFKQDLEGGSTTGAARAIVCPNRTSRFCDHAEAVAADPGHMR